MLKVTRDALQVFGATVRQMSVPAKPKCLRLTDSADGVSLSFELPRNDDHLVRHEGNAVLAVPNDLARQYSTRTLDVRDDGHFILS